jgi:hypothetical protein
MLKIRKEQMAVFEQEAAQKFEDHMVQHLREFAPSHFKILEEAEIRKIIQYGINRAQSNNLRSERSIKVYIETMFMLGSGFASDPQYPWAAEILNDESVPIEAERIDKLHAKVWDYVEHVMPDYRALANKSESSRIIETLRKLKEESNQPIAQSAVSEFYSRSVERLKQLFPKKSEYIGELGLRRLIQRGMELASSHGIISERGIVMCIALMFIVGSGFDNDPLLPWASDALSNESNTDPNKKIDQLYSSAIICLKRWWS